MRKHTGRRQNRLGPAALGLAAAAAGTACLRLTGAALFLKAGLLGFALLGAPQSVTVLLPADRLTQTAEAPAGAAQSEQYVFVPAAAETSGSSAGAQASARTAPAAASETAPASAAPAGWFAVRETQFASGGEGERYLALDSGWVRNLTDYSADEIRTDLQQGGLPFSVQLDSSEPQVLIMHTHATECYSEQDGFVSPGNNGRTTDTEQNMAAVGAVLADTLNAAGICTLQDTTLHDYPSYTGSYERSRATVESYLARYPSIKIVLDVHRDAIETDGVRVKPTAVVNGRKAAQLMIICGADDGTMNMPDFWQNLRFAAALQSAVESGSPGLTRPVLFDYRNYNQQLTSGSLLLEVGGHGNTLEEARYTAQLVGEALAGLLRQQAAAAG